MPWRLQVQLCLTAPWISLESLEALFFHICLDRKGWGEGVQKTE